MEMTCWWASKEIAGIIAWRSTAQEDIVLHPAPQSFANVTDWIVLVRPF